MSALSSENDVIELPSEAPAPRLCRMVKRSDFSGFGFNLHANKGTPGQFIGKVDENSPAERAGLKAGDRIVEVNGVNISNENHQQVVQRIRSGGEVTEFLVVDQDADVFYSHRNIVISSKLSNVKKISSEDYDGYQVGGMNNRDADGADDEKSNGEEQIPVNDPPSKARLCHLRIWPDFAGYGFNLHVDKDSQLHYVGHIDEGSPAQLAGLREEDKLIEVNGVNVEEYSHGDVVKAVKENSDHVTLLVVDDKAREFFKLNGYKISSNFQFIEEISCPATNPISALATTPTTAEAIEAMAAFDAIIIHNEDKEEKEEKEEKDDVGAKNEIIKEIRPKLRLCIVKSWGDGKGFGFNMLSHKGKPGQYIENVDNNSPAMHGGLKKGDIIVAVNGNDVEGLSHGEVVDLIKSNLKETKLLVADVDTKQFYTDKDIKLFSLYKDATADDDCAYEIIECPTDKPQNLTNGQPKESNTSSSAAKTGRPSELILDVKSIPVSKPGVNQSPASPTLIIGGVEFAATAEEARKRMAKKKHAVAQQLSIQARYEMFQKM
ncbi:hypothetical protein HELRODRAFT_105536 [Helobdella robusta]|uniref:PDZ domain-containing protein n=1 Tax=Helobdella robusta TaxID=6412 RepID=T1EDW1_HELRO|nr:hypothetical protein HELRODRAFT_105536 [Helobdella robusta]ESO12809.1 hypothetical protein HELRODRAFT_105536 [Helobdella robusta]